MGLTLTGFAVACIIMGYFKREPIMAGLAAIFFALGGAWIYTGSTTWDITRITAFGIFFGGIVISYMSFSMGSRKTEDSELKEEPDETIPLEEFMKKEFEEGRGRRRQQRSNKRMKRAMRS